MSFITVKPRISDLPWSAVYKLCEWSFHRKILRMFRCSSEESWPKLRGALIPSAEGGGWREESPEAAALRLAAKSPPVIMYLISLSRFFPSYILLTASLFHHHSPLSGCFVYFISNKSFPPSPCTFFITVIVLAYLILWKFCETLLWMGEGGVKSFWAPP